MAETHALIAEFDFDVQLTTVELRSALLVWHLRRKFTSFLLALVFLILLSCLPEFIRHRSVPPAAFIGVAWLAFPFLLAFLGARKANQGPDVLAEAHYLVNGAGIKRTTNGTSVELAWDVLFGLRETAEALLVLTNKNSFFVVPKRVFGNATQLKKFEDFLRTRLRRK